MLGKLVLKLQNDGCLFLPESKKGELQIFPPSTLHSWAKRGQKKVCLTKNLLPGGALCSKFVLFTIFIQPMHFTGGTTFGRENKSTICWCDFEIIFGVSILIRPSK